MYSVEKVVVRYGFKLSLHMLEKKRAMTVLKMMPGKREIQGNEQIAILHFLEQTNVLMYQFLFDPMTNIYSFPYTSPGILQLYEVNPEEVFTNASKALERIHREDSEMFLSIMHESMRTLSKWHSDFRVVLPSKGIRWIRGEGDPELLSDGTYLWTGYMRDITERKKIEQELEENKQRLQFALEGSRDGVWDWNVATNKTFYSNETKWMVGFDASDSFDTADFWNDRVHPDDLTSYYEDIQRHFDGKTPYYTNEHRVRCKDGNYKWILDRGKVISRNSQGEVTRVIGTHSDIDQQKKREFEFEKTIGVIESQNDRLTNFAHIVSHNLKSYAGNLKSLLTMSKDTDDVSEKAEYFNYLEDVSTGLTETIGHLNEIVTVQTSIADNAQSVNLYDYINKALQILSGEIHLKGAVVENSVPTDLNILYNPAYLESILLNLISNGLKYAHKDRSPFLKIEVTVNGEQILLKFTDNGIGIDLEKFGKRLFGMYQTFHGNEDAKGIGLFLTKNQLTAMGDEISVNSTIGSGTTFQISFHKKLS